VLVAAGAHRGLRPRTPAEAGPLALGFAALVGVRLLAQVWVFAPYVGDTLHYHLPKVAEWVQAGAITREVGVDMRSTFPAGFELVEVWWCVFLHHDVLIEAAGLEFLALAFAAAYALARHAGLDGRGAFLAALAYAMTPGMQAQATSCLNDAPAAALVVATASLVAARVHPGLILVAVGLGAGVKPTYVYALPGVALLWFLVRKEPAAGRPDRLAALALAVAGLGIGAVWYVRNTVLYGNPLHPVGAQGFVTPLGEVSQQLGPSLASLRDNFLRLVDSRVYDRHLSYGAQLNSISGWGPAAFACGAPALLALLWTDARLRRLAAAFSGSLISMLVLVSSDPWFMRFVLFFPALLAVAAAALARDCRGARLVLGAALAYQFVGTMVPQELPVGGVSSFAAQGWRDRAVGVMRPESLPPGPVGAYAESTRSAYLLYGPDFSRRVVYLRVQTADELLREMERRGLRLLHSGTRMGIVGECLDRGRLSPLVGPFYALAP
jgi:hypothetical protein